MLKKLGEELKEARLKSDLTLQQLSSKSRIDIKFLDAMESGNFSFLPELYVRAFLKEYAKFSGLNEASIMKKYEAAKQGKEFEEKPISLEKPKADNIDIEKEPKPAMKYSRPLQTYDSGPVSTAPDVSNDGLNRKRFILASVIAGTVIVIAAIYLLFFNNSPGIIVPEKSIDEVIEDNSQRFVDEEANTSEVNYAEGTDSLRLSIITTDSAWVKIILDDRRSEEFSFFPNAQKTIVTKNNFKITFGNAYGVKLKLNNKELAFTPGSKVMHVLINNNGITTLNTPPALTQE